VDIVSYALAKKAERIATSAATGIDSITLVGTQLVIKFVDGSSTTLDIPLPSDGISITNVAINNYNHLICTLSNGQTIDAGEIVGASGGTSDYNNLLNTPITNISGSESSPVVLNSLDYGMYLLTGSYKYVPRADIQSIKYKILVTISQDTATALKVASFETYEDGEAYHYSILFYDDGTCLQSKVLFSNKEESILFINEEDLPTYGQENLLYITEDSILKWNGEEYINMGGSQWGSF
jgi:hypothetical protein